MDKSHDPGHIRILVYPLHENLLYLLDAHSVVWFSFFPRKEWLCWGDIKSALYMFSRECFLQNPNAETFWSPQTEPYLPTWDADNLHHHQNLPMWLKKLKGLRNFVSKQALENFSGSPIKMSFSVGPMRSEQNNADDLYHLYHTIPPRFPIASLMP